MEFPSLFSSLVGGFHRQVAWMSFNLISLHLGDLCALGHEQYYFVGLRRFI